MHKKSTIVKNNAYFVLLGILNFEYFDLFLILRNGNLVKPIQYVLKCVKKTKKDSYIYFFE